jgi:predicted O-methyltransferase YrrM
MELFRTVEPMTTNLSDPTVDRTLDRLHAAADAHDPAVMAEVWTVAGERGALSDAEMADLLADAYMPIAPDNGRFLHLLACARPPGRIVEFGCSHGLSTIYLAAALEPGEPRLVTTELEPAKVAAASANLAAAGLLDRVELRTGDAFETLADLEGQIALLFLDGWKALYLPMLQLLEPQLAAGALVVADDTTLLPHLTAEYLAYVRDPANGYVSAAITIDDGVEVSRRQS